MKFLTRSIWIFALLIFADASFAQQSDRDRGIDLYREGKFAEALVILEKAAAADETDRAAWLYLAGTYVHMSEESKAMKAFAKTKTRSAVPQPKYEKSVKVINKPRPTYTTDARRNSSSGTVRVAVEFRADGTIGFAFPFQTVNVDLVRSSLEAAKGIRFEPAIKDGKPVTVINMVEYAYGIR